MGWLRNLFGGKKYEDVVFDVNGKETSLNEAYSMGQQLVSILRSQGLLTDVEQSQLTAAETFVGVVDYYRKGGETGNPAMASIRELSHSASSNIVDIYLSGKGSFDHAVVGGILDTTVAVIDHFEGAAEEPLSA